jgi:hypothetical protein
MIQHIGSLLTLESLIGAVFVVVYALNRFGKAPAEPGGRAVTCHSRATTTAAAYYSTVVLYCGAGLTVYAGLLLYPSLLDKLGQLTPDLIELIPEVLRQSPAVVLAMLLTVLMPKVPILAGVDEFLRTRLQHMAAIPHEVRRLAAELRRAPFRLPDEAEQRELVASLESEGFDAGDLRFDDGTSPEALWTRLAALVRRLEVWDEDSHLQEYFISCPGELAALRERYDEILPKARRCFSLSRELAPSVLDERAANALGAYREDVTNQVEALLNALYDAIGRAVLLCDLTHHRRATRLQELGFDMKVEPIRRISLNSLMLLFTAGSVILTLMFLVAPHSRPEETAVDLLLRSVMIASIYCVAIWCAVTPKSRWSLARRQPGSERPWAAYLASGLVAAVTGVGFSFLTKLLCLGSLVTAWERTREGTPWAIMTFAVTYAVAVLADNEADEFAALGLAGRRLVLVEALAMVATMVPVALFVHYLLHHTMPPDRIRPLWLVLTTTVVVAFAIGALVPSWYRNSPRTIRNPRLTVAPTEAAPATSEIVPL